MKKTLLSLAVAAGMAASSAAMAAPTVYGLINLSIDNQDTGSDTDTMVMKSQTSDVGVKGSEDLGDGMKAFYKAEFQFSADTAGAPTGRDQYIGLKGGMGTVKFGATSSNYKQMGGKVDPMYRTSLEGRGKGATGMQMQSPLHGGSGTRTAGRMSDQLQFASNPMGGMQVVVNTTFAGDVDTVNNDNIDETIGFGFRYKAKSFSFYIDMITQDRDGDSTTSSETGTKLGGTFKAGPVKLGLQVEQTEDLVGNDYMMLSANYGIDKNNAVYFAFGTKSDDAAGGVTASDTGSTSMALMYNHNMSKMTNLYVGFGNRADGDNAANADYTGITAGMRVKF